MNVSTFKATAEPLYSRNLSRSSDFLKTNSGLGSDLNPSSRYEEKRLLHKYIKEDPNRKKDSFWDKFRATKIPLVISGVLGLVSLLMGHGFLSLTMLALGLLLVIRKIK